MAIRKRLSKENWELLKELFADKMKQSPIATEDTIGMIKVGKGLYMDKDNKLNVVYSVNPESGELILSDDPNNILSFTNDGLLAKVPYATSEEVQLAVKQVFNME